MSYILGSHWYVGDILKRFRGNKCWVKTGELRIETWALLMLRTYKELGSDHQKVWNSHSLHPFTWLQTLKSLIFILFNLLLYPGAWACNHCLEKASILGKCIFRLCFEAPLCFGFCNLSVSWYLVIYVSASSVNTFLLLPSYCCYCSTCTSPHSFYPDDGISNPPTRILRELDLMILCIHNSLGTDSTHRYNIYLRSCTTLSSILSVGFWAFYSLTAM